MSSDDLQPMPIHVRRYRAETEESYLNRLLDAHALPVDGRHLYINQLRRLLPDGCELTEALSGARAQGEDRAIDRHVTACASCAATIGARWVCTRCTGGAVIPQTPHVGPFVCHRHRRWVAPDVSPGDQRSVEHRVLHADRHWQRLLAAGRASVHGGCELNALLREWSIANEVDLTGEQRFVLQVLLWRRIVKPTTLEALTRPETPYKVRHLQLSALVASVLPAAQHAALIDGLWAMLRPTAVLRRTDIPDCGVILAEPHHLVQSPAADRQIIGPLPPVEHYYRTATTSRLSRWEDVNQKHLVYRRSPGLRWRITRGHVGTVLLICPQGHRLSRPANNNYKSHLAAKFACSYCSGRLPLHGYRSLADSGKRLAVEWHPTRNGELTAGQVATYSKREVWWRCDKGHEFETAVALIARGDGCPICRGLRVLVGFNDLASLDPTVAAEWHPDRNGPMTPQEVTTSSGLAVWWRCRNGHEWLTLISVRRLSGCPVCANSRVDAGVNSLRVTHPAAASDWHPTKNGILTVEQVSAGSGRVVWWRCERGHDFNQAVVNHVRGSGCRFCKNRACWPGFNDLFTRYPMLMSEWNWAANTEFDPKKHLPGNDSHWWRCATGHDALQSVPNRRAIGGCPKCSKEDRILHLCKD